MKNLKLILSLLLIMGISWGCDSADTNEADFATENAEQNAAAAPDNYPSPEFMPEVYEITTDQGKITVRLYKDTPEHAANFKKLVSEGFYDGTLFHRAMPGFMIQGGDPISKEAGPGVPLGQGGPGYTIPAEFRPNMLHKTGALAAARMPDQMNPNRESSGSQFYIVEGTPIDPATLGQHLQSIRGNVPDWNYTDAQKQMYYQTGGTPFLDGQYTVFGEITSGIEVVQAISQLPQDARNRPNNDVKMTVKLAE